MHHLLERQLKKIAYKEGDSSQEQIEKLITLVDQAYIDADDDRGLLENALNISSKEMQGLYKELESRAKKDLEVSEKKYERLVRNLKGHYFFYTHDTSGIFRNLSDSVTDILGYSKGEFLVDYNKHLSDDPINKRAIIYSLKSLTGKVQPPYKVSLFHKDGTIRYLELTEFPLFDDDGQVKEVEGIARDITQQVKYSTQLKKLIDLQQSIVFLSNGRKVKFVNKAFLNFLDYKTMEDFLKQYSCICEKFVHDDNYFHLGKVPENMHWLEYIQTIGPEHNRIVLMLDKNEIPHAFAVSVNEFSKEEYIVSFADISSTMTKQINLEKKVLYDNLTKAYSREYFDANYRLMIEKSKISGEKLGVMMLDIDHFKKVNDSYGHNVGDEVLKRLVRVVKSSIRANDALIRWGGEEFIILTLVGSVDNLYTIAEHIRRSVEGAYFELAKHITISMGMTFYNENEEIKDTIKRADDALYKAKNSGRNRVEKDWN